MEEINPMEKNWDNLIILDACRYDYFKKIYRDHLPPGTLKKTYSPATNTIQWCKRIFRRQHDDVVYISTNPFINSKTEVRDFNAKRRFFKIVDVWDWGWDEELGTVPPEMVNRATRKAKDAYPGKRLIIHYLQPHGPYLTLGYLGSQASGEKFAYGRGTLKFSRERSFLGKISESLLGQRRLWKLRKYFGMPPLDPLDAALRKVGEKGL